MTREEAINELIEMFNYINGNIEIRSKQYKALNMAIEALKEEPRIMAKWLPYEYGDETWHKCSNCGKPTRYLHSYNGFDGKKHLIETQIQNYCRYCGAKMEEENETD